MPHSVPASVLRLLERCLPPRIFEAAAGDIEERWRRDSNRPAAVRWLRLFRVAASVLWHVQRERRRVHLPSPTSSGGAMLVGILRDLRFTLRLSARQPWLSGAAVITLALGVGAATAMFSVMNAWIMTPLPYREADRLVMVWETIPSASVFENTPAPASLQAWRARARAVEQFAEWTSGFANLTGAGDPARLTAAVVSHDLLPLLGVSPLLGRNFTPEEMLPNGPPAVMLTHESWRRRFGGRREIVGERITLSGTATTVVGVLPRHVRLLHFNPDIWQPLRMTAADRDSENRMLWVMARLGTEADPAAAAADVDAIMRERSDGRLGARVVPLQVEVLGSLSNDVPLLFGAAAFVLLIACANVSGLTLARIAGRHEELVVRRALGASRARILRQILTESVALGVAGGAAGLLLASWAVRAVVVLAPQAERMPDVTIGSPVVFLFAFAAATITVMAFGLLPAWHSARAEASGVIRTGGQRVAGGRQTVLRAVVVGEVALALALLIGAALVARSYQKLSSVDLGFDPGGVVAFELWRSSSAPAESSIAFYEHVLAALAGTSGIRSAGLTQALPLRSAAMGSGFVVEGAADHRSILAYWRVISPDFLNTLSIPLLEGRHFDNRDREGSERTAIVSASFARRAWPAGRAIGRRIGWATLEQPITVVGVAGDVRVSPAAPPEPHVYLPYQQAGRLPHQLVVHSDLGTADTIALVRRTVSAGDPTQPISGITSMDALHTRTMGRRSFQLALFSIAAAVALLLALVGIYGVLSYAGRQMSVELGVRLALGASRARLLWHVMRMGVTPTLLGVALGGAAAWSGAGVLRGVLFGVEPRDPAVFALTAAVLTLASLAACLLPAWRAALTDPLITMRSR